MSKGLSTLIVISILVVIVIAVVGIILFLRPGRPFDFSISANPNSGSVLPGKSSTTIVKVVLTSGSKEAVSFSCSNLPLGASCKFSRPKCLLTCSSAATITSPASTQPGTYETKISATGGGKTKTTTFLLTVISVAQPSLLVIANPAEITTSQSSTITATLPDGKSGVTISFEVEVGSLSQTSCTTDSTGKCFVVLTSSESGESTVIASASGYTSGSTTVTVTSLPSLSVSASPSTVTTSQSSTITATTSDAESGVSISFSTTLGNKPASCTTVAGSCSSTFTSTAAGAATITATATGYTSGSTTVSITPSKVETKKYFSVSVSLYTPFGMDTYEERIRQLSEAGVNVIRIGMPWKFVETREGSWNFERQSQALSINQKYGIKTILILSFNGFPDWFTKKFPDSRLINEVGDTSKVMLSVWSPTVQQYYTRYVQEAKKALSQYNSDLISIEVAATHWGDTLYPPPQSSFDDKVHLWMYDPNAKQDYRQKFGRDIPLPGTVTGQTWEETLNWYLDSKDEFVRWTITETKSIWPEIQCLVLASGSGITDTEWDNAVTKGSFGPQIAIGATPDRYIKMGNEEGCQTAYTAFDQRNKAEEFGKLNYESGNALMWGENAAVKQIVDPVQLAQTILLHPEYNWHVLYVGDEYLFGSDGKTPSSTFDRLNEAVKLIFE